MARYNKTQLEHLWISVGGNPQSAPIAAAVALAESGGNPNNSNVNTNGTTDRGLWQINSVHGALSTYDPVQNARSAVNVSNNGRNWSPWTQYKNGAYRSFLTGHTQSFGPVKVLEDVVLPNPVTAVKGIIGLGEKAGDIANFIGGKGNIFDKAKSTFKTATEIFIFLTTPAGWVRILKVIGGGVIIIIALNELAKAGSGSSGSNTVIQQGSSIAKDTAIAAIPK